MTRGQKPHSFWAMEMPPAKVCLVPPTRYLLEGRVQAHDVGVVEVGVQARLPQQLELADLMQLIGLVDLERHSVARQPGGIVRSIMRSW